MSNARIRAAAEWLMEDDSAYEMEPEAAYIVATHMLACADDAEPEGLILAVLRDERDRVIDWLDTWFSSRGGGHLRLRYAHLNAAIARRL